MSRFKTMRHIETVRNYLDTCQRILATKAQLHDQTKLESPEVEIFDEFTGKLRTCEYGSDEYRSHLYQMQPALEHHYKHNRHHPEFFEDGIDGMNMFDLLEMLVDWKAAGMRHNSGSIEESLEINQKRFGYSDEMKDLLSRTIKFLDGMLTYHKAEES